MEVVTGRNLSAIRFIRCAARVPNSSVYAGGTGFTLGGALARCESELAERDLEFNTLRPAGVIPMGIAAHRSFELAQAHAAQEAIETLCVKQIHADGQMQCIFRLRLGSFLLGLSRTEQGFFCLMRGLASGKIVAAHSAAKSIWGVLSKTWEEYRSFHYYKPTGIALKRYTKANLLFSEEELRALQFPINISYIYRPQLSALQVACVEQLGRKIVYFYKKNGEAKWAY